MFCCAIGYVVVLIITFIVTTASIVVSSALSLVPATFSGGAPTQLQKDALRKYKQFKKPKQKISFDEYCNPKSYKVQRQQAFAGEYMRPGSGHKSLLVFHKIGAGKTCLSIQVAERWKGKGKPLMIMPASLIPGFRAELRSPCAGTMYITEEERVKLMELKPGSSAYKEIIRNSDKRIDNVYHIFSYNKFASDIEAHGAKSIKASIIIIDEVQNVANLSGVFFKSMLKWIEAHPDAPSVVMSGTPVFDNPRELRPIAKLLKIPLMSNKGGDDDDEVPITPESIRELFAGKVSYYAGAPPEVFPETFIKVKKCQMSKHQARWYKSEVETEMSKQGKLKTKEIANDFYIKSRQRSNIVYPNGLTGMASISALTPNMIKTSLETYSCKYAALMKKLKKNELSFIYTSFTGVGGIAILKKILKAVGYLDFAEDGPGKRRFAIFSGEETMREKGNLQAVFNSPANDDASQIQVVIGSPAIKEGVSLKRVRQAHILELYWNYSRLSQIFGRAVRYCSHKSLPKDERDVTIYLYAAVAGKVSKPAKPIESIDLYMLNMADEKKDAAEPYVQALMDCAIDKYIHYPAK